MKRSRSLILAGFGVGAAVYLGWHSGTSTSPATGNKELAGSSLATFVATSPDGTTIAAASPDGIIRFWNAATGLREADFRVPVATRQPEYANRTDRFQKAMNDAEFSPDGRYLAVAKADHTVRVIDVSRRAQKLEIVGHLTTFVRKVAYSPDGKLIASAALRPDGNIYIWNAETGDSVRTFTADGLGRSVSVIDLAFSPAGQVLASINLDDGVCLWDLATGKMLWEARANNMGPHGLAFSLDGKKLAVAMWNGTLQIWDTKTFTGGVIGTVDEPLINVAFTRDGQIVVAGGNNGGIFGWRTSDAELLYTAKAETSGLEVKDLHFLGDRPVLVYNTGATIVLRDLTALVSTHRKAE